MVQSLKTGQIPQFIFILAAFPIDQKADMMRSVEKTWHAIAAPKSSG